MEKKEKDNFLRANNDKIKINICVADFCSYCFNINFIKKAASFPMCCHFFCSPTKSTTLHWISIFRLILLSVKLNLNFYTSHLSSILFSSLIADFIFANLFALLLSLIHQEITLVSILIPDKKYSIKIYIFFLLYYILGAKNCLLAFIS